VEFENGHLISLLSPTPLQNRVCFSPLPNPSPEHKNFIESYLMSGEGLSKNKGSLLPALNLNSRTKSCSGEGLGMRGFF